MGPLLRQAAVYGLLCLLYGAWMTGGTFHFDECRFYPTYDMLGEAMAHGRLYFEPGGVEDTVVVDGRAYLYSGPLPAVLRIPLFLIFGKGLPSGLMVVLFCAGVSTLFPLALREVGTTGGKEKRSGVVAVFGLVMALNGYSLFMVTVPSVHHEAIAAAVLFLTVSVWLVFRALNRTDGPTIADAVYVGLSFGCAIVSRAACIPAIAVLGLYFAFDLFRRRDEISHRNAVIPTVVAGGIAVLALGILLAYNMGRFGSPFDFGMHNQQSLVFHDYFKTGNYFRYDHLPLNLWNIFFRLPAFIGAFPYLLLPAYVLKIQSVALLPYQMVHSNELAVSIFFLMPITIAALVPLFRTSGFEGRGLRDRYLVLWVVFGVQVLSVSMTVATTARYYYEFVPALLMLSFLGIRSCSGTKLLIKPLVVGAAILSIVLSLAVPLNAIVFYSDYLLCDSPLVALFKGP